MRKAFFAIVALLTVLSAREVLAQTNGLATFSDNFSTGQLNTSKWQVNAFTQNNYAGAGSNLTSRADHCIFTNGMLTIQLDQPTASTSTGCELQSKQSFGYGTYEWVFRSSSTSTTPTGPGVAKSGSIATGFIISDANSKTEIDSPEIEGQRPSDVEFTNWLNLSNNGAAIITTTFNPSDCFHKYRFIWTSTSVTYFIDDVQVAQHTTKIPLATNPGFILISHYGTNSSGFGGVATPGVTRYMYITSFKYWLPGTPGCTQF